MSETLNPYEIQRKVEGLKQQGFMPVGIDLGPHDFQEAMRLYLEFIQLEDYYHDVTRYNANNRGDGDFGQYRRQAGTEGQRGTVQDNKDIFHFGAGMRQVIESRIRGTLPRDMRLFLGAAEEIFWSAQNAKKRAFEAIDSRQRGLVGIVLPENGQLNDVLRFIAYYPNEGELAKGHFDRSVATLALAESHEGLRIAPGQNGYTLDCSEDYMRQLEGRLQAVEHVPYEAKFFLAAGWNRLPNTLTEPYAELPISWHDVVPSDKTVDTTVMRWAIVNFINPHNEYEGYTVPTQPETRPYKQLGKLTIES